MAHNCVDWTAHPPARKTPLLVLTHGVEHIYTPVPKALKTLQETARREFNLGDADVYFLSTCASLCHGKPARITEDAWEHVSPYIGCATVKVSRPRTVENQPQDAASGDEQCLSAKRKLPLDADQEHENDQQMLVDAASEHGNDPRASPAEDDKEQSRVSIRPRARRRLASEEEDEQEPARLPIASQTPQPSPGKESKRENVTILASQSAEPDITIKQEKHTRNASQSTHTESDTLTQTEGEKLMIRVAHPPSNQEAKFKAKGSTSVAKVIAGVCRSFGLDVDLATLCLIVTMEGDGGNMEDLQFPCDNRDTISRAGAEYDTESRFMLKLAGEA